MQTFRQKETLPRPELIYFLVLLLLLSGCHTKSRRNNYFELNDKGAEKWILDSKPLPASDSLFYQDDPAPLFRKEFRVDNNLKSAKLLITAAGYYKASVNGERVGDNFLDPAWTDFSKRIYYSEYDISEMVETGKNSIGVTTWKWVLQSFAFANVGKPQHERCIEYRTPRFYCKNYFGIPKR